jgi:hypothetical protein
MVRNLLQKSASAFIVWNRSSEACTQLAADFPGRVTVATSPGEVVRTAGTTFCMLSTAEASAAVVRPYSLIHLLTHSFTYSLTFTYSPTHLLTYSLTFTYSPTYSPLIHLLTHLFTKVVRTVGTTHSLTHSLTHSVCCSTTARMAFWTEWARAR